MSKIILLVTRPNYDYTTRYISAWAQKIIDLAGSKGNIVLDLDKERACKKELESMVQKHSPSLIFLNGHGNDDLITGQNGDVLIQAGENEQVLEGTITYALSCRSAKVLGKQSIVSGARAYIGYEEDFTFMYTSEKRTRPDEDKTAAIFLDPSNQIMISLLKGHDVKSAYSNAKNAFLRNIQKSLTSESSSDDSSNIRYLLWDMQNLAYHGDGSATVY